MQTLPIELTNAALNARDRLSASAGRTAVAGLSTTIGGGALTSMAEAARGAVFCDALLGAMRARFEELRTVAK